jgi:lipopolysaccharide transport system ATP-binding protein
LTKPIIEVENLSKHYRLGSIGFATFIDDLRRTGRKLGLSCKPPDPKNKFVALDDVSFSVEEGEVLGIIGHNGAGKSTLLKILSRITEPTSGTVTLRGRVASLLEVGTGFHGDMTGKENIYLNGSLYGLTRKEISEKLDSIIDFSQTEDFIDTPVKRYSSGMYVRLAFAVAVHLEPEILIIDEVLAVGDAGFKEKCKVKLKEFSSTGRTALFVSHNLEILESICPRAIILESGKLIASGSSTDVVSKYLSSGINTDKFDSKSARFTTSSEHITVHEIDLVGKENKQSLKCLFREEMLLTLKVEIFKRFPSCTISISIFDSNHKMAAWTCSFEDEHCFQAMDKGTHQIQAAISPILTPGDYYLGFSVCEESGNEICCIKHAIKFTVSKLSTEGSPDYQWGVVHSSCHARATWKFTRLNN